MFLDIFKISHWKGLLAYIKASNLVDREKYAEAINIINDLLENKKAYVIESHYYILGRAYLGIKDYEKAKQSFLISIENNPYNNIFKANTYFLSGLSYYELQDFNSAIKQFNRSLGIKEKVKFKRDFVISIPHIYCYLSRAYKKLGNKNKAVEMVNKGLKYEPANEALQRELTILGIG